MPYFLISTYLTYVSFLFYVDKPINTKLTTNTGKHEVAIHETLVLNCSAQAFPPANLFIFSTTKNSTLQESPISTYTISREIWSPAEQYTCLPKNILGEGLPDSVNISFLGTFWLLFVNI